MIGDIVLLNRKKGGWFSSAQRFFTGMPYTHCTFSIGEICGVESVLSADEKIVVLPLDSYFTETDTDIEIYRITCDKNKIEYSIKKVFVNYSGFWYGFTQVIWFIWRWLMEKFDMDVRRKNNPFKSGIICSELVYYYLVELNLPEIKKDLEAFTPDTIHAGDIANILKNNADVFRLREKKQAHKIN